MCECGYEIKAAGAHDFGGEWLHDADGHWHACRNADCTQIDGKTAHTATDDGDCTTALVCECGYELKAAQTHDFGGEWLHDADGHWHACRNADCTQIDGKVAHAATDDGDCTTALVCECGYELKAAGTHDFGAWTANGDGTHTRRCQTAGCTAAETETCTGGTATCTKKAVCERCGAAHGGLDAANHTALTHVPAKAATTEATGHIEHWHCTACGKYYRDAAATEEIAPADIVTDKLPTAGPTTTTAAPTTAPTATTTATPAPMPTGEDGSWALWLALTLAAGGLLIGTTAFGQKKRRAKR